MKNQSQCINRSFHFGVLVLLEKILSKLFFVIVSLYLFSTSTGVAQEDMSISGYFKDVTDGTSISDVSVQIAETGQWTVTDSSGYFKFSGLNKENYTLLTRMLAYKPFKREVSATSATDLTYYLLPLSIELDEVTVTAREATLGSASQIEGYAIKHTQPISLSDILQLVPGQLAQNPELGNVTQFTIRQAPTSAAAQRMNALGTAIVMDGAPISNNANLQTNTNILNASSGSLPPFSSVAGRGLDLRSIPADFIESVEVIRGIPSARYGDLTAGVVLVNTRLGAYRPKALVRITPTIRQLSVGAGKKLGKQTFNAELDFTTALTDPRNDLEQYKRANLQLGWSNRLGQVDFQHRLMLSSTLDETVEAPEGDMSHRRNFNKDRGFRLNSRGRWKGESTFLNEIRYIFSISYQQQESFFQEQITRDIFPVTDALSNTTLPGEFGKSSYLNQTSVDGKPLNAYIRLEMGKRLKKWLGNHRLLVGAELRHDSNKGSGRQFDPKKPPRQNYSMGDRPRTYASIPHLNQIGFYFSDRWSWRISNKKLLIDWGFRSDMMYRAPQPELDKSEQHGQWFFVPAPRINASLTLGKGWKARAGFGITAKMPTLSYLYPNPVFFDLVNFNYFATEPSERLVILTTRKIVPNTSPLRPYQSKKWEVGVNYRPEHEKWDFSLSFFREQVDDAYQIRRQILPIENQKLKAINFPKGQPPQLSPDPIAIDTFMAAYDLPQNNLAVTNRGFDFTLRTPQIEKIRTSFNLTGALLHTKSRQTTPFLDANRAVFSNQFSGKVPIFPTGQGRENTRFSTSLRLIHHIPELQFIVSGLIQTVWIEQGRYFGYSDRPIAYLARSGERIDLSDKTLDDDLVLELGRTVNPKIFEWQKRPILWLFNIRLTKEWASGRGFSFYINNVVNSKPFYTSNISGFKVERNQPEFTFGAEIYYQF